MAKAKSTSKKAQAPKKTSNDVVELVKEEEGDVSSPLLKPKPTYLPTHPVHFDELAKIWDADKRIPSAVSRRAWAEARWLNPHNVNSWWYRRKKVAKKLKVKIPKGTYELDVGVPPDVPEEKPKVIVVEETESLPPSSPPPMSSPAPPTLADDNEMERCSSPIWRSSSPTVVFEYQEKALVALADLDVNPAYMRSSDTLASYMRPSTDMLSFDADIRSSGPLSTPFAWLDNLQEIDALVVSPRLVATALRKPMLDDLTCYSLDGDFDDKPIERLTKSLINPELYLPATRSQMNERIHSWKSKDPDSDSAKSSIYPDLCAVISSLTFSPSRSSSTPSYCSSSLPRRKNFVGLPAVDELHAEHIQDRPLSLLLSGLFAIVRISDMVFRWLSIRIRRIIRWGM